MSIPVICDRCRTVGLSGDGDFSHLGDLLDFTPVPRKTQRADGWTPERQRAFIAALSATGSKRQAARAIGMAAFGIDQILKADGNESFKAAYERAMAIAKANGSMKIAAGVADAAARNAQLTPPSRLRGLEPEPQPDVSEDQQWDLLENIAAKFMKKVAAERQARLAGEIVSADFYLRQITFMEVTFDLTASQFGWDALDVLKELRRGCHPSRDIVSTPFADWLDQSRRQWWAEEGEPERPPHPDTRFLKRHSTPEGDCGTYADDSDYGATTTPARGYTQEQWAELNTDEQKRARQEQFAQDAEEQREWEAKARADFETTQILSF
jgi:hypothetical protein